MEDESEDEWQAVNTPDEACIILHGTIFEFASVLHKLCLEEEKLHPSKYANKLKPSAKIAVVSALLKIWDNNKSRLAEHYVNYVLNWKKYIDDRNDRFFLENDHIYPRATKEDIEFFRDLWRPQSTFHLSSDEKESVYEYFDTMIHYCQVWKDMTKYVAEWEKTK